MKITRDNYESWFLDYLEGRLEEGRREDFLRFLDDNRDLKEELSGFEPVTLDLPEVFFDGKETLKKEFFDLPEAFDQAAAARMEGDSEPAEALRFEDYLQRHPEKQADADLFLQTRLIPDLSIVFPGKENLVHRPVIRLMMTWTIRVAAVLLVAALVFTTLDWRLDFPESGMEVAGTGAEITGTETDPLRRTESDPNQETGSLSSTIPVTSTMNRPAKTLVAQNRSMKAAFSRRETTAALPHPAELLASSSGRGTTTIRETVPPLMSLKKAALDQASASVALARVTQASVSLASGTPPSSDEPLLANAKTGYRPLNELLMEKTGLNNLGNRVDNLSISKITRFGLKLAAAVSNEKFSYDTNTDGEIIAYNLDTRLLGLSIPVRKD